MRAKALANKATERHHHKAAAREKALADKADKQHHRELTKSAAALEELVSAAEQCHSLLAVRLKTATDLAVEKALAEFAGGIMGCNVGGVDGVKRCGIGGVGVGHGMKSPRVGRLCCSVGGGDSRR